MKTQYLYSAIIALTFACSNAYADADGSKSYELDGFSGVKASAGISVTFEQADNYSVIASFERADEDDVKIRIDGDILKISYGNSHNRDKRRKVTVAVTAPQLDFAKATSGAALNIEDVTIGDIKLQADSGGALKISGTCSDVSGGVSSGGAVNAKELKCTSVNVRASSGGSFRGYASSAGKCHSSSGGSIVIYGGPETQKKNKSWSGGSVSFP